MGVTVNSLYLSFSLCKATNLTANSLLFTMHMVSPQTVFTYPFHRCKATNLTARCHLVYCMVSQTVYKCLLHGVTANSLYLFFSPCTNHRKQVSPQTIFTYPFHHAKLQILLQKQSTNLTTWCHRKQSLLILFTLLMQSYKSYYMVSPQTVFTYPFHHAKLQILLHGVTVNSLYLSFSRCKATNLTTWCHRKQSLLILFTMQSYKSYYMVSPQTVFC